MGEIEEENEEKKIRESKYLGILLISGGVFLVILLIWVTIYSGSSWDSSLGMFVTFIFGIPVMIITGFSLLIEKKNKEVSMFLGIVSLILMGIFAVVTLIMAITIPNFP